MTISTLQKSINERLDEHYEEMVEIRRHLHMNPELSFQEEETAAFIANYYDTLQIPTRTQVGGHGVLAFIEGASPGQPLPSELILMHFPSTMKRMCLTNQQSLV